MEGETLVSHLLGDVLHGQGGQAEPSPINPSPPSREYWTVPEERERKQSVQRLTECWHHPNNAQAVSMQIHTFLL